MTHGFQEGFAGAMEGELDFTGVAEEIAKKVVVGIVGLGFEGEGEAGVGIFAESLIGVEAPLFEVVDDFLHEDLLEADFHLLGAHDAPSFGG